MAQDPHERAFEIFERACDLNTDAQADFVNQACGDDAALRDEVLSLLSHDQSDLDFDAALVEPARQALADGGSNPNFESKGSQFPDRIGHYRIIRRLGEGGMGEVFEAEQESPRRRVALKIIRASHLSEKLVRRFEHEAFVLGQLQHPGIAHIYESGMVVVAGRQQPFFAMELIDGVPLGDYADRHSLTVRQRLELIARVCDAVQHAHQKGIIHRDLKPANILVVAGGSQAGSFDSNATNIQIDEIGVPKILDFGVARVADSDLQAATMETEIGQLVGTLAYMSPEQASGDATELDTRCDVYALGVILYQLLSGRLPHDLSKTSIANAIHIIQQTAPPRLSSIDASWRGDLDIIAGKALEKDISRRYQTPAELASDIRRFLRNEPIEARPPCTRYQIAKFAQRNKALVGGTVATVAAIFVGAIVTGYFAMSEHRQRALAEEAGRQADAARLLADNRYEEVMRLADLKRLNDAEAHADALWPELPNMIPQMQQWLDEQARPLADNLDQHQVALEHLREQSEPIDDIDGKTRNWRFSTNALQWQHDTLTELVTRLDNFVHSDQGAMKLVAARQNNAALVGFHTLESPQAQGNWQQAINDVKNSELYRGLEIKPQAGLVPIGTDPKTGLVHFLHLRSGGPPHFHEGKSEPVLVAESGIVLVLLPGGNVPMGAQSEDPDSPHYDPYARHDEAPVRKVSLDPFYISKYEITQAQWQRLKLANPSGYTVSSEVEPAITVMHPVEQVTWNEAKKWLPRYGLTLPTEAQWEYAARAGTDTAWWTGNDPATLGRHSNLADVSLIQDRGMHSEHRKGIDDGFPYHAPVGKFGANAFGLFDIAGNVSEWCIDSDSEYRRSAATGTGLRDEIGNDRKIVRGGSWEDTADTARSACRKSFPHDTRKPTIGVRPVIRLAV